MALARGKYALAICDDCNDQVKYSELKPQPGRPEIRVCRRCLELPMPGYRRREVRFGLKHPRPGNGPGFDVYPEDASDE